jgi:hypothetical protein
MRSLVRRAMFVVATISVLSGSLIAMAPAPAFASSCFSLKDSGTTGGAGGYFLTDDGHNQVADTTGTGACWRYVDGINLGAPNDYYLLESQNHLCLDVASDLNVYMESCVAGDPNEEFTWQYHDVNGANVYVWQNYQYTKNLTAFGIYNGAGTYVAGGPATPENYWLLTYQ